jgi:hypothetical protein
LPALQDTSSVVPGLALTCLSDRMAKEVLLGAVVMLAAGLRARPIMDVSHLEPGPLYTYDSELRSSPELEEDAKTIRPSSADSRSTNSIVSTHSSVVSPLLSTLFEDYRELIAVEEMRVKYATTRTPATTRLFRWSHARKVTVRSRVLHYWCDLNDTAKGTGAPQIVIQEPVRTGILFPVLLTISMEFALCCTLAAFDRCIFEEHYQPAGVYREARRYHLELATIMSTLRPDATTDFSYTHSPQTDPDIYDRLWIYGVGAYMEGTFIRPDLQLPGEDYFHDKKFFGTRFGYLVATMLEFSSFGDVTGFLARNYLYYPRLMDESLRKLVQF